MARGAEAARKTGGIGKQRALILQGGGALGAYAAGAFGSLCTSVARHDNRSRVPDCHIFDILAGTSIGAVNAAILVSYVNEKSKTCSSKRECWEGAGEHLADFWGEISSMFPEPLFPELQDYISKTWDMWADAWNSTGTKNYVAKWEAMRRYYQSRHLSFFGAKNVFSSIFTLDTKYFDPINFRLRFDNGPLKEKITKFAKFPIKTGIGQPRLLLEAVDIRSGAVVTFDSYDDRSEYSDGSGGKAAIEYPRGIEIEHLMATMSLPVNQSYQTLRAASGEERTFWDGAILSNTPLREVNRHHRSFWKKQFEKSHPDIAAGSTGGNGGRGGSFIEYEIPDLEVYIVSLWPTSLQDAYVPNDNDFVMDRLWDLFYHDKTMSDEHVGKLVTDYIEIIRQLVDVGVAAGKQDEIKEILSEPAISNVSQGPVFSQGPANEKKRRRELVFERFLIKDILRISLKDDEYTISNKFGDYSEKTIKMLMKKGKEDAEREWKGCRMAGTDGDVAAAAAAGVLPQNQQQQQQQARSVVKK